MMLIVFLMVLLWWELRHLREALYEQHEINYAWRSRIIFSGFSHHLFLNLIFCVLLFLLFDISVCLSSTLLGFSRNLIAFKEKDASAGWNSRGNLKWGLSDWVVLFLRCKAYWTKIQFFAKTFPIECFRKLRTIANRFLIKSSGNVFVNSIDTFPLYCRPLYLRKQPFQTK